ncbi:helix-turn-helix domain-containing protein [Catellatospora sp. NPDC049609]|uniref:helix-turn-helix domain-containing protein n=1 Tax=Catellatospora sp. NPDC049609 TaxID=3155505 RepID=UPI0034155818
MLGALGLAPDEEAVYRALLARPSATAMLLADALELPEPAVDKSLNRLVDWGLALRSGGEAFIAAPPAMALGALITERRDGLRMAEQALVSLAEEHRASVAGRSINDLIEVVTGVDAIRLRFQQVQQAARREIRNFVTAPYIAVRPGQNSQEDAAARRGVRFRVVLERAVLAEPDIVAEVVDSLHRGVELRVVDSLPMKLILADEDLALVPITASLATPPGSEPGAVLLHRSGLLSALEALFETVWLRAYPLELSAFGGELPYTEQEGDGPTELDRRILSLLLSGLTDQAVATQLDLSLRTLQRRLRHLMDLAGVESRMQLGWHAARHGWA